jgi:ankyrin repeat protein
MTAEMPMPMRNAHPRVVASPTISSSKASLTALVGLFLGSALLCSAPLMAAGGSPLLEAVKNADISAVRALIKRGVDVSAAQADGTTALHWAADRNDAATVELLVRAGANVSAQNRYGVRPLSLAAARGSAELLTVLLKAGAKPNITIASAETPLMTAARAGNTAALRVLLSHGADVNAKEASANQTALMWAASANNVATMKVLMEGGADTEAHSTGGFTALLFAARAGALEAVKLLVAAGVNPGEMLPDGTSGMVIAISNAHYELAAYLLGAGADPNANGQGWTALHQIAWTRRPMTNFGMPPPSATGSIDSLQLAKILLAGGADPNSRSTKETKERRRTMLNSVGATPLLVAGQFGDVPLVRLLLANGGNATLATKAGTTPLAAAAGVGIYTVGEHPGTNEDALDVVKQIYNAGGTDVNAIDGDGYTAAHGAAHRGSTDIIQFLYERGAKLDVVNKFGWTPLIISKGILYLGILRPGFPETEALLERLLKEQSTRAPLNP